MGFIYLLVNNKEYKDWILVEVMVRKSRTLERFTIEGKKLAHQMGNMTEVGTRYFFNIELKDGSRFRAEEKGSDYYYFKNANSGDGLGVRGVICYYLGKPNSSFPVAITDKKFKPLYIEKGYEGKIEGFE